MNELKEKVLIIVQAFSFYTHKINSRVHSDGINKLHRDVRMKVYPFMNVLRNMNSY